MKKTKNTARIIGILILTAYGVLIGEVTKSIYIVLASDVISGLSVIGIAYFLSSYFKTYNNKLTLAYLFVKIMEGALMILGGILYLINSLQYIRGNIYEGIHLYTFIIGGYILYYLMYKTKIVPRFIAIWGFIAISSLFLTTFLKMLNISYPTVLEGLLVLIITNEVFLAFWLIFKGFNPSTRIAKSANVNKES
jgi:hypothetical protein